MGLRILAILVPDGEYEVQLHVVDAQGTPYLKDIKNLTIDLIPTTLEISGKTPTTVAVKTWDINPLAHWKLELFDTENVLVEKMEGDGSPPAEVFLNKVQGQPAATYTCKLQVQDIAGNQSIQEAQLQLGAGSQSATVSAARLTLMVGLFCTTLQCRTDGCESAAYESGREGTNLYSCG